MRIGINKENAKHVDAYVNDYWRQKGEALAKEKGLNRPIGFTDLLPEEEKYGYQIEQEYGNKVEVRSNSHRKVLLDMVMISLAK